MRLTGKIAVAVLISTVLALPCVAQQRLFGVNPFNNGTAADPMEVRGLFELDINTGAIISGMEIVVPGQTVLSANGLTVDPTTGTVYVILKTAAGLAPRSLATIDVTTGNGVFIGSLGDAFAGISFRANGQLYGSREMERRIPSGSTPSTRRPGWLPRLPCSEMVAMAKSSLTTRATTSCITGRVTGRSTSNESISPLSQ